MQSLSTFIKLSGPIPEVTKNLDWSMIGKTFLHIGNNINNNLGIIQAKQGLGKQVWLV